MKGKLLTLEQVQEKLKNFKVKLIGDFTFASKKAKFKCFCGKIFFIAPKEIYSNRVMSCGCIHKKIVSEKSVSNLINKKFERLLVISRSINTNKHRVAIWLCKCDCGKMIEVYGSALRSKKTKSCGCLKKEISINTLKNHGYLNKGKNNPNYNHLLTKEERLANRYISEYNEWVKNIYSRDNYKCRLCNSKNKINAHHLDGYHWCKERRFDISNGITLCYNCHINFHKIYGHKNNTERQFNEYEDQLKCLNLQS